MDDWNLYHKLIMTLVIAFAFIAVVRAVQAYLGGGLAHERVVVTPYSAEAIWPMVSENDNRERWEAYVTDITRLSGEAENVGSTRFLFWRNTNGKKWVILEQTTEVLKERVFRVRRQSDYYDRTLSIELDPIDQCKTRVTVREIVVPVFYADRFWSFIEKERYGGRLDISMEALERWLNRMPACKPA